jgi:FecR protein
MFKLPRRLTAMVAACLFTSTVFTPGAGALSTSANPIVSGEAIASITSLHGTVFKRGFVDWGKELWGEPESAVVNDKLREGMQIGTGNESWAEVAWPNVKTRAWSNTVFAIAPNKRLVYLTGGEMLFRLDKNRKDKDQSYYIWTKVLQARIRGTTVLVQAKGDRTRFTVMEGTVEVTNRLDHSKVTIKPGVVYEVIGYKKLGAAKDSDAQGADKYRPTLESVSVPPSVPPTIGKDMTDILYDSADKSKIPLFQDSMSSTNIYPSNSEVLRHHPLNTAGGEIDSMSLISGEQGGLPGFNPNIPLRLADQTRLNNVVANAVKVNAVPTNVDYFVGDIIGKTLAMPDLTGMLQPRGVILNLAGRANAVHSSAVTLPSASVAAQMPPPILAPINNPEAETVKPGGFAETEMPMQVEEFAQKVLVAPVAHEVKPSANPVKSPSPEALQPIAGTGTAGTAGTSGSGGAATAAPVSDSAE